MPRTHHRVDLVLPTPHPHLDRVHHLDLRLELARRVVVARAPSSRQRRPQDRESIRRRRLRHRSRPTELRLLLLLDHVRVLLLLHDESLAEHGGMTGLRDEGLLDSALGRPENLAFYGTPDIADLAASYGVGLAKNHPFIDGNKRAAFLAAGLFLMINGQRLSTTQVDATQTMLDVAAGVLDEAAFAEWIRQRIRPRTSA